MSSFARGRRFQQWCTATGARRDSSTRTSGGLSTFTGSVSFKITTGKGGEKSIKDLLEELKNVIDEDDDGTVTEEEYLLFCLKREQKVDEETLDILRAQFQALDADGSGELDEDDVVILTEKCNELGL